jgi:hypothetical protein
MSKWRVTFQDGDVQIYGFFPTPPMGWGKIERVERIPDPPIPEGPKDITIDWPAQHGKGGVGCSRQSALNPIGLDHCLGCGHFRGFLHEVGQGPGAHATRPLHWSANGDLLWRASHVRCAYQEKNP